MCLIKSPTFLLLLITSAVLEVALVNCYNIKFSRQKIGMVLGEWENFTIFISNEDNNNSSSHKQIVLELHSSHNSLEFYPQSIELYLEKFSNWSHLILIRAQTCGKHTINCYIDKGNKTLANAKVDIIKNKFYEQFSRKLLLFYYIFGLMSVYPQLLNNFLYRSVNALSFTYVIINFVSYLFFTLYARCMLYPDLKENFINKHPLTGTGTTLSDNIYAVNGLFTSICLITQAINYANFDWVKKDLYWFELFSSTGVFVAICHYVYYNMDSLYTYQFMFLFTSIIKYFPQLYKNFLNKHSREWNMFATKLEMTANLFLLVKLIITSYNYDDKNLLIKNDVFWITCVLVVEEAIFVVLRIMHKEPIKDSRERFILYYVLD